MHPFLPRPALAHGKRRAPGLASPLAFASMFDGYSNALGRGKKRMASRSDVNVAPLLDQNRQADDDLEPPPGAQAPPTKDFVSITEGLGREPRQQSTTPAYTNLVDMPMQDQIALIQLPQWMVELWQEAAQFGSAARRLFLPESSVKNKLPFYRQAVLKPEECTYVPDDLKNAIKAYHETGFKKDTHVSRHRGARWEIPPVGLKSFLFANIVGIYLLSLLSF